MIQADFRHWKQDFRHRHGPKKIPHCHEDRGRYYYRRKVPLELQDTVGLKEWREAVGDNFEAAVIKVRNLPHDHDALIQRPQNPEDRRDHKTKQRRAGEVRQAVEEIASDAAYRKWLSSHGKVDSG